ncbi:efflux RND transporter periplasmic adaptor subunit [Acerihabitans sp. TG2]|uniref:efflux RND transporter periplasmic adaptor subunit n=1 Tax=Acerihabitans sp. TG2 TaxID=3096008 RepID=UPI002B237F84|nr:efflux RND transporter periplasmic adaptor subunit [Acerihabitans sp. TG2]MEA9392872.1 efflux RND transporter periplasmic adaptor subunit [Acerihabitans sp. TG2]
MTRLTTGTATKRVIIIILALAALAAAFVAGYVLRRPTSTPSATNAAQAEGGARRVLYWYDPMSPSQRFDKPGKSPFMDMPLTPRYANEAGSDDGVTVSARQQQNLGVRLATAEPRTLSTPFEAFGTVTINDRGIRVIPARANGLVEKLYVRAEQQQVTKGQPLARLWIPEWSAAQQEYLAIRHLGDPSLSAAARQRLQLLFMPEDIIHGIEKTGRPQTRIDIRAPEQGFISRLAVREGSQVSVSQAMFELSSLDPVWVVVDYPESQAGAVAQGSELDATTSRWPGEHFHGRITEMLPVLDNATRTYRARIALENPDHRLQPGMYVNVRLAHATSGEPVLAIPLDGLIQTGSQNTVLLAKGDGHFTPVKVTAGQEFGEWVEIRQGLSAGDRIVTSGQFLIDSEASLRSALPQMAGDTADSTPSGAPGLGALPALQPQEYTTQGVIDAVHGNRVTLSHQAVAKLKWPPMTMDFTLPATGLPDGITVGSHIMFHFTLDDNGAQITQMMGLRSAK